MNYQPFQEQMLENPYPCFAIARRSAPVFYSEEIDHWVVSRHLDIRRIFLDPDTFSAKNTLTPLSPLCEEAQQVLKSGGFRLQPALGNHDRPGHTPFRQNLAKIFTTQLVKSEEPFLRVLLNELVDSIEANGQADLIEELIYKYPAQAILKLLGFPKEDMPVLIRGGKNRNQYIFGYPDKELQIELARDMASLFRHCIDLIAERKRDPQDDVTSALVALRDDDNTPVFSDDQIASVLFAFFTAGHDSTASLIANAMRQLLGNPGEWRKICNNPSTIPNAVEETLRHDSSVVGWRRFTNSSVEIAGVTIPKGAQVLLLLGAANRDETKFAIPDRFDTERKNAKEHLSFGKGIHTCFGNVLARLETKVALEVLSSRLPSMRLIDEENLRYMPNLVFRTLYHLKVRW